MWQIKHCEEGRCWWVWREREKKMLKGFFSLFNPSRSLVFEDLLAQQEDFLCSQYSFLVFLLLHSELRRAHLGGKAAQNHSEGSRDPETKVHRNVRWCLWALLTTALHRKIQNTAGDPTCGETKKVESFPFHLFAISLFLRLGRCGLQLFNARQTKCPTAADVHRKSDTSSCAERQSSCRVRRPFPHFPSPEEQAPEACGYESRCFAWNRWCIALISAPVWS